MQICHRRTSDGIHCVLVWCTDVHTVCLSTRHTRDNATDECAESERAKTKNRRTFLLQSMQTRVRQPQVRVKPSHYYSTNALWTKQEISIWNRESAERLMQTRDHVMYLVNKRIAVGLWVARRNRISHIKMARMSVDAKLPCAASRHERSARDLQKW